jgi:hypothetical protein
MSKLIAEGRKVFEEYARRARTNLAAILATEPQYDGCGVRIGDDLRKFPLGYGITRTGELRRFCEHMFELHRHEGIIAVIEIVDDVNYGLSQHAASVITLHKAARIGRAIYFNLNFIDDIPGILADRGRWASNITGLELRYIHENWELFQQNITFWREDLPVRPPWEEG